MHCAKTPSRSLTGALNCGFSMVYPVVREELLERTLSSTFGDRGAVEIEIRCSLSTVFFIPCVEKLQKVRFLCHVTALRPIKLIGDGATCLVQRRASIIILDNYSTADSQSTCEGLWIACGRTTRIPHSD